MRKQRPTTEDPAGASHGDPEESDQQSAMNAPGREDDQREPKAQPGTESAPPARSGDDTRQRGWFWHWNGIITQYAPLIGLKGVGLLNSYTAWTDRRENSPHRGYAFPSQQSEAAFYGEDRAELITINKILVALDLIEIRKVMVEKADEQGRRWKVPHNFYRVKDRADGLTLTTADVLRVAELAERDRAVYRYVRRVFSVKFAPIDRNNIWHQILQEVQRDPTWQTLAAQTAKQEARASARTKAGHRSRAKAMTAEDDTLLMTTGQLDDESFKSGEQAESEATEDDTSVGLSNNGSAPDVAATNRGSEGDADEPNNGSAHERTTSAEETNTAPPSVVEPGNTMYYQETTTTTTTTPPARTDKPTTRDGSDPSPDDTAAAEPTGAPDRNSPGVDETSADLAGQQRAGAPDLATQSGAEPPGGRAPERGAGDSGGWGPLGDPSTLVVSLFEAANDRTSTRLERVLLSELERDAAPAAETSGSTGADWVAAALREAVGSGSSFVAPKRIREIVIRWAAEGAGPAAPTLVSQAADTIPATHSPAITQVPVFWISVLEAIKRTLDDTTYSRLLRSSDARRVAGGGVEVLAPSPQAAGKLDREYRPLIERHLARALGRSVAVTFVAGGASDPEVDEDEPETALASDAGASEAGGGELGIAAPEDVISISPADEERGRQLWQAVLHDLSGAIPAGHLQRLKGVIPLGQNERGAIILGAPNQLALQFLTGRYRSHVETGLTAFLGQAIAIDVIGPGGWSVGT